MVLQRKCSQGRTSHMIICGTFYLEVFIVDKINTVALVDLQTKSAAQAVVITLGS